MSAEPDPGRAPTGVVTNPGDLLKEPDGTEFRFSYFPSSDRLRLVVLRAPETWTRWEVAVSPETGSQVLARGSGALPFAMAGETLPLPALGEGAYRVRLTLSDRDGKRRELLGRFERQRFLWENSPLGRDRVIVPPFTALKVEQDPPRVACVLREHEIAGSGLWKQVFSQGRPLLASPMRLELQIDGQRHCAEGNEVRFSHQAADRVLGSAAWSAGAVRGRTEFDVDYDGMTKVTLHLDSTDAHRVKAGRLESMQLVIPMRSEEAWLLHPVTDLLRFHYAGRIPNGKGAIWDYGGKRQEVRYTESGEPGADGKVWDSRHVGRWKLPAPFVPYIWLGGPERGIAWFAENDRDWSLDPSQPALEIRRNGGATSLVVRLITSPVALGRPRTLVFGLMTTPAKPMPERPVHFRRWWPGPPGEAKDVAGLGFMGACYYWGAAGPCASFYPAFRNFTIYDEFARLRPGAAVDRGFTDRWLSQFSAPEFAPHLKTYRAHVNWTVQFFSGGPWKPDAQLGQSAFVIPYTNARAVNWGDEARTFLDEWSNIDIADPRWPAEERFVRTREGGCRLAAYGKVETPTQVSGIAYAVDPVPSWQDMVLHYHRRMLETFADGVYFDNYFLVPNYSPGGPGYVDDEGRLRPGVNIFGFHEFTRRIATMQHQMGRRPMIFIHMTNANIVPMLSHGTLLLDHEWRDQGGYHDKDFQERLDLDEDASLLLAQSTGLQSGCLGIVHNLFHGDERLNRSALGVALTHEMKLALYHEPLGRRIRDRMLEFGYGRPDCQVWRYWDNSLPVKIEGAEAKALALARGGRVMLVVASYGPGGDVRIELDRKLLPIPGEASAVDSETGKPLQRLAPLRFQFHLPRHDFRLVRIGGNPG